MLGRTLLLEAEEAVQGSLSLRAAPAEMLHAHVRQNGWSAVKTGEKPDIIIGNESVGDANLSLSMLTDKPGPLLTQLV